MNNKFFVGSVVTFLILFGLINVLLGQVGNAISDAIPSESQTAEAIQQRIKPVASVTVGEAPAPQAVQVAASDDGAGNGKQITTQVCAMCHASGMMGSPKLGNKANWAPRIDKGIETLYTHAINGFNMMPARGGNPSLSDDDVKAAVDYMVSLVK
jgi:cytochrome c5